ncbi:hypothetical protein CEB3_c33480 [Peptococcaceae bacterium CEB3]|nr:hypothetical protein CEB3_c33480 [Peptococcaceae bacterium CEB3]
MGRKQRAHISFRRYLLASGQYLSFTPCNMIRCGYLHSYYTLSDEDLAMIRRTPGATVKATQCGQNRLCSFLKLSRLPLPFYEVC